MDFFYPPDLPITSYIPDISELIHENQVTIIAGDTGSGKTTQLPKICLELFEYSTKMIGCTQPRRIAATSVCERVKEEMGSQANLVGSKIRFRDHTSEDTRIKFMTDGILLAETRHDPRLDKYDVIIVDEAHERSLNIDFLLGYLHRLLPQRPDLKLVITSATIDTLLFSKHFNSAPILQVEGRAYPIEMVYYPPEKDREDSSFVEQCIEVVEQVCQRYPPGDILVFLPTERDIRSCCEVLKGKLPGQIILPLFGRLQSKDQQRIFKNYQQNKIVVASNVAETSVTVPGIRYVVDTGLARIASYDHRSRTTRLPVTKISQASCNQRAGRCGRLGPGTCFRLFEEEGFNERVEFTVPEIQRSNLAEVILQMVVLNLGDPADFPFLNPPKTSAIREGFRSLIELGAIDKEKRLSATGKIMAGLPIDPVVSRIIIEAQNNDCLREIIIVAAALAIQDPRVRPADREQLADKAHKAFYHPQSDFISLLSIWTTYHDQNRTFSWGGLKRFCLTYYLSFQRMREWIDLHDQLKRILKKQKTFKTQVLDASYEAIHRSLLSGLFRQCARKKKGAVYQGITNNELTVFPGSQQYLRSGDWIIAGSFIETSRLFALTVASIEPEWIEMAAKPFCSYSWTNARWQKKSGQVIADEQVSLQGLPLFSGRSVNFARRDKKNIPEARTIFIQKALVENLMNRSFSFLDKNIALLEKWQESEHKLRRKNIVIDESTIFNYYQSRLPQNVYDRNSLIRFVKKNRSDILVMSASDVLHYAPDEKDLLDFPSGLLLGENEIKLTYCFEPGTPEDGVTVHIPDYLLDHLGTLRFDWLVPGLIVEKTTFLIKGLPKKIRKRLIPVSSTVELILDSLDFGHGNYLKVLGSTIFKRFGFTVQRSDWPHILPDHLLMRFSVFDAQQNELMAGRDLSKLTGALHGVEVDKTSYSPTKKDEQMINRLENNCYQTWDFEGIPDKIPCYATNNKVSGYLWAALQPIPEKQGVRVKYFDSLERADEITREGTHYLFQLHFKVVIKQLKKYCRITLTGPSSQWLMSAIGGTEKGQRNLIDFVLHSLFGSDFTGIIDRKHFEALIERVKKEDLYARSKLIIDSLLALLRQRREVYDLISKYERLTDQSRQNLEFYSDLYRHLDSVMPANFLEGFVFEDADNISRYLKSLAIRTERGYANPSKDLQKRDKLAIHLKNLIKFQHDATSDECRELYQTYRFLVSELHVSLFSPEIKTATSVSEKKLQKLLQELRISCSV